MTVCIDELYQQFPHRRELSLKPFLKFLSEIGNPHLTLSPVIHVAGTNGKGSTVAMLKACFEKAGYRVHSFTSPHLHCVTERFLISSKTVDESELRNMFSAHLVTAKACEVSWYEFLTGIFFTLATQNPADVVILETGLGGEYDATNVVPLPRLGIITPISNDHADMLGPSIKNIAKAKAGIIKRNMDLISHQQDDVVRSVLQAKADEQNASLIILSEDLKPQPTNMLGDHQQRNAGVVKEALKLVAEEFPISEQDIASGLMSVFWPGRLEVIQHTAMQKIYLDVAHNPESFKVISNYFRHQDGAKALVFLLPKSKDLDACLRSCVDVFDKIYAVRTQDAGFHTTQDVLSTCKSLGVSASKFESSNDLQSWKTILFAGSHHLTKFIAL